MNNHQIRKDLEPQPEGIPGNLSNPLILNASVPVTRCKMFAKGFYKRKHWRPDKANYLFNPVTEKNLEFIGLL
jgi:hypothetical protein